MMPLETYLRARRAAPFHVQVELTAVPLELPACGGVRLAGRVTRLFRGQRLFRWGDDVSFEISVCRRGADIPTGGAWWIEAEATEGIPPQCQVALWQSQIIDAPSERPRMGLWRHEPGWRDRLVFLKRAGSRWGRED